MKLANRKPVVFGVVAAFLLVIFLQMFLMARDNSATFDEPFHIYSGYLQWKHGYVTLNPPLITRLITLPLIGMNFAGTANPKAPLRAVGVSGRQGARLPERREHHQTGRTGQIGSQNLDGLSHLAGGWPCFHKRAQTYRQSEDRPVIVGAAFVGCPVEVPICVLD
jgi:hypothetical protein